MSTASITRTELGGLFAVAAVLVVIFGRRAFRFPTLEPAWLGPVVSTTLSAILVLVVGYATFSVVDR